MDTTMETPQAEFVNTKRHEYVPLSMLRESGLNTRKDYNKQKMDELVASIKSQGIIENLVLRPIWSSVTLKTDGTHEGEPGAYEVICGNRRWKAAVIAGNLTEVPASIIDNMSDDQAREIILIENIQREDQHPLDTCEGYVALSRNYTDLKVLAGRVGKEPKEVRLYMALNNLLPEVKKKFRADEFPIHHAIELARLTPEQQKTTMKEMLGIWRGLMTIRELREFIQRMFHLSLSKAPFDTTLTALVPKVLACVECPKRTGFDGLLFPDIKEQDTCTDPVCYKAKVEAHIEKTKKEWIAAHPATEPNAPLSQLAELSTAYGGEVRKGVLQRDEFQVVKGKDAKVAGVQNGIIVSGDGLGKIVSYMIPKSGTAAAAAKPMTERKASLQSKERELEGQRRNAEDMAAIPYLMTVLRGKGIVLLMDECQLIASEVIRRCYHDMLKRYCDQIFGPKGVEKGDYNRDYSGVVEKRAREMVVDVTTLAKFILELMLFNHIGSRREKDAHSEGNPIYTIANARKIKFDEVWKPIAEAFDVKKQRAAARLGLGPSPTKIVGKGGSPTGNESVPEAEKPKKTKAKAGNKARTKKVGKKR
jgi:ParB/RepB/Spo0J family partition protein